MDGWMDGWLTGGKTPLGQAARDVYLGGLTGATGGWGIMEWLAGRT